jgi:hypothetical protein
MVILLDIYVSAYAILYYRGVSEMNAVRLNYFFYVPFSDIAEARRITRQHAILEGLFGPLNKVHSRWLGGKSACKNISFGPDGESKQGTPTDLP